jgi:hypothetical protein
MALHNLKITVVDGGKAIGKNWGSGLNKNDENGSSNKKSTMQKMLRVNNTMKSSVASETTSTQEFALQAGVKLAVQAARQSINYYISDIGRANGDNNYQAIINNKIEKVTDVLSLGQAALSGAVAGSIIPGVGTVIGAVVGAASSAISLGFKYAERKREYQHEMFKQNTSQAYMLTRANYSAMTGRVR